MSENYKEYNIIEPWLQILCRDRLRLSGAKIGKHNPTIDLLLKSLKDSFMNNNLFAMLFSGFYKGGSYYDKLKTIRPDEYDINVLLRIPSTVDWKINHVCCLPGYVKLSINNMNAIRRMKGKWTLKDLLHDHTNKICINKLLQWFESLIAIALNDNSYEVFYRTKFIGISGPAITLKVASKRRNIFFYLDLSPCFIFNDRYITLGSNIFESNEYFLVPKPLDKNNNDYDISWRLSYPEQERELIFNDKESFVKSAIKLLKIFRVDDQNIKSYYIKSLALLIISNDPEFFHRKSLSYSFMQLLLKLKEAITVGDGYIPFVWDERLNLLDCNSTYLLDLNNRIDNFIKLVKSVNKKNKNKFEKTFMSYFT